MEKLKNVVIDLIADRRFCFHSPERQFLPDVLVGDNNLDTCMQFDLIDEAYGQIAKIKFYDKVTDLVSRES